MNNQNNQICQYCRQNPAELTVSYQRGEDRWDVHLCAGCADRLRRHTERAMREYHSQLIRAAAGGGAPRVVWNPGEAGAAVAVETAQPDEQTLERLRTRRELSELRARLELAVNEENYEDAARLRDQINRKEKEVSTHDGK